MLSFIMQQPFGLFYHGSLSAIHPLRGYVSATSRLAHLRQQIKVVAGEKS